jgi:hypothetical protein
VLVYRKAQAGEAANTPNSATAVLLPVLILAGTS